MNIKIEPRKMTDRGGYLMLPLVKNIPYPANDTWKRVPVRSAVPSAGIDSCHPDSQRICFQGKCVLNVRYA